MRFDPVLHQARVDTELILEIVQHLADLDYELFPGLVLHRPRIGFFHEPAGWRHPVQRLVRAAVGVYENRAVRLDHQKPQGHGQMGRQSADVVNLASSDDEPHCSASLTNRTGATGSTQAARYPG